MATKPEQRRRHRNSSVPLANGMWGMNFEHIPLHNRPHGFMILALRNSRPVRQSWLT
jgi:hypothetical protein